MSSSPYFAAIDLGSNSFHMLVGRISNGQLEVIDREKEMVQIARGLDDKGRLDESAKDRALECLHRFSERLRDIPAEQVRAVGTKTLRSVHKSGDFLRLAAKQLGHPIQIISGYEEARLVYCGLSHSITNDSNKRLVIDIGGGSTEFIIGKDYAPLTMESLSLGCVAYTKQYFNDDRPIAESMNKAYMAACDELEAIRKAYLKQGWDIAYGTSGTVKAISELTSSDGAYVVHYDALTQLMQTIMDDGGVTDKSIAKLRRDVLPAGIAILKAIFDQLNINELHAASASLKDGLIFDTVGRFGKDDARNVTVNTLKTRYAIEEEQAKRVSDMALSLWANIKEGSPSLSGVARTKVLKWAAELHEIGLSISHSSHHNHGYYILQHSDLGGFGRYEQYIIANLVRFHRKKIKLDVYQELNTVTQEGIAPLILCLRLAVLLSRRREDLELHFKLHSSDETHTLTLEKKWLELNPLTRASLLREVDLLRNAGVALSLEEKCKGAEEK